MSRDMSREIRDGRVRGIRTGWLGNLGLWGCEILGYWDIGLGTRSLELSTEHTLWMNVLFY